MEDKFLEFIIVYGIITFAAIGVFLIYIYQKFKDIL